MTDKNGRIAAVLLSGGLDSAVSASLAQEEGYRLCAVTFLYGQRHAQEINSARRIAQTLGAEEHLFCEIDERLFIGPAYRSRLTPGQEQPTAEPLKPGDAADSPFPGIPATYVPARNLLFLSYAAALAETRGAEAIFIGANCVDYSGYPDCRPAFLDSFERTANLALAATAAGGAKLFVRAPLLHLTKADIVREGLRLRAPLELTHSCYFPDETGAACGACDSCRLRLAGFQEAGATDPVRYAAPPPHD